MDNNDDILAFAYHLGNYECADGFPARARVAREACRDAPRATAPQSIIGLPEEDVAPAPEAREAPLPKSALFTQEEMKAMPEARRRLLRALLPRPTP